MNYPTWVKKSLTFLRWSPLLVVIALTACNREPIRSYSISKEDPSAPSASAMPATAMGGALPAGHPAMGAMTQAPLAWKTPTGWNELPPTDMRVGSFEIKNPDGKQAIVTIIPLTGPAGGDFANVNIWRQSVGLAAVTEEEFQKLAQRIEVSGQPADLFEQVGKTPDTGDGRGILGVIQHREGTSWFFKMTGDPELVAQQKPMFMEFLKSVNFQTAQTATMAAGQPAVGGAGLPAGHPSVSMTPAPTTGPISHEGQPTWQIPTGWQEVSGGQFLIGKFLITGENGAQAAVNVSSSVGDGGGLLANLNRWRVQQLQLSAATESDLGKMTSQLDVVGGKATFVDLTGTDVKTGQPARMVGAMVQQSGKSWFYKLMGDPKIVEAQKDAFTKFVQTVKY